MIIILLTTTLLNFILFYKMSNIKNKNILAYCILYSIGAIFIANLGCLLQYLHNYFLGDKFISFYETIITIPNQILCVLFLLISIIFTNLKRSNASISILFVIPIICGLLIASNDIHNLAFSNYSLDSNTIVYGPLYYLSMSYGTICLIFSYIVYITILIKENNEFSKTANYLYLYAMIPITIYFINIIYNVGLPRALIPILCTPISFILQKSIFKEKTINITSIANADILNKMQSTYIILDFNNNIIEDNHKIDFKLNFYEETKYITNFLEKVEYLKSIKLISSNFTSDLNYIINNIRYTKKTYSSEFVCKFQNDDFYFSINIVPIISELRRKYIGCLITINDITKQKLELLTIAEDQEMIITQQHLATIGELTSGFAHDINTPLSAIQTAISIIEYNPKLDSKGKHIVTNMKKALNEISNFSSNVRTQLRNMDSMSTSKFSVNIAINNIINLSKTEAEKNKCNIIFDPAREYYLVGNSSKFSQVISNILINAIQAYDQNGGNITIELKRSSGNLNILISDNAKGIPESLQSIIFKKILATNKETGNGLGLYISHSIIKSDFNGTISFTTKKDVGTTFKISIPISNTKGGKIV